METAARVVLDSISPRGDRLTTLEVTMHRFVLAEFNTHRIFSRNSASSRAIPVEKQLEQVKEDPAYPVSWPCEQPGMSGGTELEGGDLEDAKLLYKFVHEKVWREVDAYLKMHPEKSERLHKSVVNRFLEPFMWHTVLVSSTGWENFRGLRCSPQAQPEMRLAAEKMMEALDASTPTELDYGQWHMPFMDDLDELAEIYHMMHLKMISAARCARVSYLTHGTGVKDVQEDLRLAGQLQQSNPIHASPFEHVARPLERGEIGDSNFWGWWQYREDIEFGIETKR